MSDKAARTEVLDILMERDGITREEAEEILETACQRVAAGEDPEDVLQEEMGLEPDYIWAVLP